MQAYAYDADLDYLTQAKYDDDGNGTWDATHNWTCDVAGNRASDSSNTGTWVYDALNRMTASPGLGYENDILGNRVWQNRFVSTSGMRMEWDVVGRMTSACKVTGGARYEYRADGMRIKKVEGLTLEWQEYPPEEKMEERSGYYDAITTRDNDTNRYRYDGQMLIEDEYTRGDNHGAFVDVTRNGLGARGIDYIAKTTSSGTTVAFPIYDGHGNMVATLGRNGTGYTLGDQRHYDAWGKIRSGSATGDPKGRYVANIGHVQDDESGLVYMRARYYEPSTGRFASKDSGMEGTNWYVYCRNNPIHFSDPSGESARDVLELLAVSFFTWLGVQAGSYVADRLIASLVSQRMLKKVTLEIVMEARASIMGNLMGHAMELLAGLWVFDQLSLGGRLAGKSIGLKAALAFFLGFIVGVHMTTLQYVLADISSGND